MMLIQMSPGSEPQESMHQNMVILLDQGMTIPEIEPSPGSSNQKTPCWSNSDPGPMVGPNQFQMNLQIEAKQI